MAIDTLIPRAWIARGFTIIEDLVYIGLGLLLAANAVALLINGFITFGQAIQTGTLPAKVISLLENTRFIAELAVLTLLILILVISLLLLQKGGAAVAAEHVV